MGAEAERRASLAGASAEEIRRHVAGLRPELSEATLTFRAAVLLLLGPEVRFNIDRLSSRTRYPRAQVAACARRLFDHGVWRPDGPDYPWTTPSDPQFWSDVAVAEGRLCRRVDSLGKVEWAEPGVWKKAYDFVTRDAALTISYVDAPAARPSADEELDRVRPEVVKPGPSSEAPVGLDVQAAKSASEAGTEARRTPAGEDELMEPVGAGVNDTPVRHKWVKVDGLRRSDPFPDAQWLS